MVIIATLWIASIACVIYMAYTAPEGYQDHSGFHYGPMPH